MTVSIRRAQANDADFLVELMTHEEVQPFLAAVRASDLNLGNGSAGYGSAKKSASTWRPQAALISVPTIACSRVPGWPAHHSTASSAPLI